MSTTSDSEDGEEEHWETEGPQTLEDLLMPREPADFTAEQFEETRNKKIQQSTSHEPNTSSLSQYSLDGALRYV